MVWIDYAIIAVIAFSSLVSLIRGFVREALSLVTWGCAFFVASHYYTYLSVWFTGFEDELVRNGIAIAVLFIATLIVGAIVKLRDRPAGGENGVVRHRSGAGRLFRCVARCVDCCRHSILSRLLYRGVEKRRLEQITADPAVQFYHQMVF
ncbi:colicin V production protein [Escherichia coli]|uniref:Colicin V production protein n=1 Tax=Escherichia coli TaxID=562 RepID=A0A376KPX2_ECOLX|nr:colicin V production protein [Escherichia coli]